MAAKPSGTRSSVATAMMTNINANESSHSTPNAAAIGTFGWVAPTAPAVPSRHANVGDHAPAVCVHHDRTRADEHEEERADPLGDGAASDSAALTVQREPGLVCRRCGGTQQSRQVGRSRGCLAVLAAGRTLPG
jgi:hypothetical protein